MTGVLTLLKDIHKDKAEQIEKQYWNKAQEIEKELQKRPEYKKMTANIDEIQKQIEKLEDKKAEMQKQRDKAFPDKWQARDRANKQLQQDYLDLRVKTTLNGIPKERVKKMVEDFHNKDYLAKAMGS